MCGGNGRGIGETGGGREEAREKREEEVDVYELWILVSWNSPYLVDETK